MKIRLGFVSNSSSSSFIIDKKNLTELQINLIKNHIEVAKLFWDFYKQGYNRVADWEGFELINDESEWSDFNIFGSFEDWEIIETEDTINGDTVIDNFSMSEFLQSIKVDEKFITWRD